jgi:hypothetical protein
LTNLALDYAFIRPTPERIKAAGYVAVGRYLGGGMAKDITRVEAAALHAVGLPIFLVFEGVAARAMSGRPGGEADAYAAKSAAAALGYPTSCPIFFAVDFDADPASVRPYFEGVHAVLDGRTGVYGGIRVTKGLRDLAPYRWQTCAWSGTDVDPQAHLYQRQRPSVAHPIGGTDEDVILTAFPMWTPAGPITPPPGVTWTMWPAPVELRPGSTGDAVRVLQTALADSGIRGARGIAVTGTFDAATETATRNFQATKGLTVDGIAGPKTRTALITLGDVK